MGNVQVYERPSSADRPSWLIIVGVIIALLCVGAIVFWGFLYNDVDVEDHKTVSDHTIHVEP